MPSPPGPRPRPPRGPSPPPPRRLFNPGARHAPPPRGKPPPPTCQPHHILPRSQGGRTCLNNLLMLCTFHHLIAVHRWGWGIVLLPDGTVTATSPDGRRILRTHSPPAHAACLGHGQAVLHGEHAGPGGGGCPPAHLRGALRRRLPSSLVPRSSVQATPRPRGSLTLPRARTRRAGPGPPPSPWPPDPTSPRGGPGLP